MHNVVALRYDFIDGVAVRRKKSVNTMQLFSIQFKMFLTKNRIFELILLFYIYMK